MEADVADRVLVGTRQEVRFREVGCQWESPAEQRREAGCQSEPTPTAEAGVQVELPGQPARSGQAGEVSCTLTGAGNLITWRSPSVPRMLVVPAFSAVEEEQKTKVGDEEFPPT